MGQGYSADPLFKKFFRYATHADVLENHPRFECVALADSDPEALSQARKRFPRARAYADARLLIKELAPEVIILATGPDNRLDLIRHAVSPKAVLCEKPLGQNKVESTALIDFCEERNIILQVNLLRRADTFIRSLKNGGLENMIGEIQCANAGYGNGLRNNGCHVVDVFRMLLGEVSEARILGRKPVDGEKCPIKGDSSHPFFLLTELGVPICVQAFNFENYREIYWDFRGSDGALFIGQEGLLIRRHRTFEHRALAGNRECAWDVWDEIPNTLGTALYDMYDNLHSVIETRTGQFCSGRDALKTESIIEKLCDQIYK